MKKETQIITGLQNDENKLIVQKSKPLFALWKSELTLAEFKILDTYLARIDSHHPERRRVIFEKGELEEKLGVQKIDTKMLKERLRHLMGNVVEIPDGDEQKGFRLISLFEEAIAEQDKNGLWQVKLECTQAAMKYIFNIEALGYYRYKLRCITSLTSRYTYFLFIYLESRRRIKTWQVELETLKELLGCDKEETYKEYKYFNNLILKKAKKELFDKTDCRFSYEPIKKGRTVIAIRFTLESLVLPDTETPAIAGQINFDDMPEPDEDNWTEFYQSACCPAGTDQPEFSPEEMEQLMCIVRSLPDDKLPANDMGLEFRQHAYLQERYAALNRAAAQKKIKHRFAYMLKMIKSDAGLQ